MPDTTPIDAADVAAGFRRRLDELLARQVTDLDREMAEEDGETIEEAKSRRIGRMTQDMMMWEAAAKKENR